MAARATRRSGAVRRPVRGQSNGLRNGSRPLVIAVAGAVLLAAAGLWVLRHRAAPAAPAAPPAPAPVAAAPAKPASAAPAAPVPAQKPAAKAAAKAASRPEPKPPERFTFYEMLQKAEVPNPPKETQPPPGPPLSPVTAPGTYVLHVGTWPTAAEAERVRARLAQRGIHGEVQDVTTEDRHNFRVRIGPVEDLAELNRLRRQLRDAHVEATLQRVGD